MTTYITTNSIGSGLRYALTAAVDSFNFISVLPGVTVASTDNSAFAWGGVVGTNPSDVTLHIDGTVEGNWEAIDLGNVGGSNTVSVGSTGIVRGGQYSAMVMGGAAAHVDNFGQIFGNSSNNSSTISIASNNSTFNNAGVVSTVQSGGAAVDFQFSSTVLNHAFTNTGTISASGGAAAFYGSFGHDTVINSGTITGAVYLNSGNDRFDGRAGHTFGLISAGNGLDTIFGGSDADTIFGGGDADLIYGELGADSIAGDVGNDTLYGGAGIDTLNGGDDNDWIYFDSEDSVSGGNGADTGSAEFSTAAVHVYAFQTGLESIIGSHYDDFLSGEFATGPVTLTGYFGNDTIKGSAFADILRGWDGNDLIYFDSLDYVEGNEGFDFATAIDSAAGININTRTASIEGVYGSIHNDTIDASTALYGGSFYGHDGNDTIRGSGHSDLLHGGDGNDEIWFDGNDQVIGGAGFDFGTAFNSATNIDIDVAAAGLEGIYGSSFGDIIDARNVNAPGGAFYGYDGDDVIYSSTLTDYIHGGNGRDVSAYVGNSSEYSWSYSGGTGTVTRIATGAVDTIVSIEVLRFGNGDVVL